MREFAVGWIVKGGEWMRVLMVGALCALSLTACGSSSGQRSDADLEAGGEEVDGAAELERLSGAEFTASNGRRYNVSTVRQASEGAFLIGVQPVDLDETKEFPKRTAVSVAEEYGQAGLCAAPPIRKPSLDQYLTGKRAWAIAISC